MALLAGADDTGVVVCGDSVKAPVGDDVMSSSSIGASVRRFVGAIVGLGVGCEEGDAVVAGSKMGSMQMPELIGKAQVH